MDGQSGKSEGGRHKNLRERKDFCSAEVVSRCKIWAKKKGDKKRENCQDLSVDNGLGGQRGERRQVEIRGES